MEAPEASSSLRIVCNLKATPVFRKHFETDPDPDPDPASEPSMSDAGPAVCWGTVAQSLHILAAIDSVQSNAAQDGAASHSSWQLASLKDVDDTVKSVPPTPVSEANNPRHLPSGK